MIVARDIQTFKKARVALKSSVGFVPTMGALHEGHISLVQQAKAQNEAVIVSIFVNPTQFLEGEDLDAYPRQEELDLAICEANGVDIVLMPTIDAMYGEDELKIMAPLKAGYILEGATRPGHFDGMLQIVMKLLNLTQPTRAYFGKKDAQQLALIMKMVNEYFMNVEIVPCEIVRDTSGLALSSRNAYLNSKQIIQALSLSQALNRAMEIINNNELNCITIKEAMLEILTQVDSVDYVQIVNRQFQAIESIEKDNSIILVAAYVGTTRLIDNVWV
ncbi:MAG: pantoate--beta-alanine ligase [Campylobacterales bacterium]|nr:pantoate--beta-alanine ligase [Campylobacterales bacterium]